MHIVINNATIARLGLVVDVPIEAWDASYRVNLRGPALLARAFLPGMLERDAGVFVNVSSTGSAYMGVYETFKAAQVHLTNTLDAELEGTGVIAFTIGPGFVPTETAINAIAELAPQLGMDSQGFFEKNAAAVLTVEEAEAGFAVAVVLAEQFRGVERTLPVRAPVGYPRFQEDGQDASGSLAGCAPGVRNHAGDGNPASFHPQPASGETGRVLRPSV